MGRAVFRFNGVDQYATIPGWVPNGLPYSVEVNAVPLTVDSQRRIYSGDGGTNNSTRAGLSVGNQLEMGYVSGGAALTVAILVTIDVGVPFDLKGEFTSGGLDLSSSVYGSNSRPDVPSPLLSEVLQIARRTADRYWHGPIYNLRLTDNSPIQNTDACFGDGTRYVQLDNPIVLAGDFEIEFDWIRQDRTGTGATRLMGSATATNRLRVVAVDSGNANANRIIIQMGVALNFDNALDNVAQGQHCSIKIRRTTADETLSLWVDGVKQTDIVGAGVLPVCNVGQLYTAENGEKVTNLSAMQNVKVRDLTNNRSWEYKLDEGAGTVAKDTGGQGNDGQWTPDVDWQFIPDNSRWYPMDEQTGTEFRCLDGNGVQQETLKATIVNPESAGGGWDILPPGGIGSGPGIARSEAEFDWLGLQPGVTGDSLPDRRASFFGLQGISTWREYYNANGGTGHISDWLYALFTA